jgi:hypothetical protein
MGAGSALRKIVRRDRSKRLGDDPLGGFARQPRAVFAADEGHRAGRNADATSEIRTRDLVALKPVPELHATSDSGAERCAQLNAVGGGFV